MIRIFKIFLWLIAIAVGCLFIAKLLSSLGLGIVAALISAAAGFGLLFAYSLIVLLAVYLLSKSFIRQLANYFHPSSKSLRQQLSLQYKRQQLQQQQAVYRYHIDYTYHSKRLSLLRANNKKQVSSLSTLINKDLQQLKKRISKNVYKQLKTEQRLHARQQHLGGLIQLHQNIIAKLN